jgi:FkbM family methyltransferase
MEHRHTEQFGGISATFETNGFWEVASLLHTFRKESTLFEDLVASLEPDDAFYDIGANFGTFSCFAGKVVSSGEVYAFEPHPDNVERTRRNLDLNDLEAQVLQCALSDESDESELAVDSGPAGDQRHSLSTDDAAQTIGVATEPGDKLISERALSPPSVLKNRRRRGRVSSRRRTLRDTLCGHLSTGLLRGPPGTDRIVPRFRKCRPNSHRRLRVRS